MTNPAENQNQNSGRTIEMLDEAGQTIRIPRLEYISKVLPHNLQLHWDNPDDLASTIMDAFNHTLYLHLEDAVKRLMEIDTTPERAVCLYAAVLLNTKRCAEAETLLLNYLQDNPRHPYVLANLAKAQEGLDKRAEALATLEESLIADPNQEHATTWWVDIRKEQLELENITHERASLAAYKELNERFGGWLAKLWLGEYFISKKEVKTALTYYEAILAHEYSPHMLTRISADLGKYGFPKEAIRLIVPCYHPRQHDIETGLNLLQAYLELKHIPEGQQLLRELYAIKRPDVVEHLDWYKIEFANLAQPIAALSECSAQETPEDNLNIKLESIDYPLWCYGWNIKHGFDTSQSGKKIALMQFSCESESLSMPLMRDLENTEGRLARAIPLFLLEVIYYGTDASASVIFPVSQVKPASYVLYSSPTPRKQVMALADQGFEGVVTGMIAPHELKITYWDLTADTQEEQSFPFDFNQPENTLSHIETFVFDQSGIPFDPSFQKHKRGFQAIPEQHQHNYLMLSSQHLILHRTTEVADSMISEHHLIQGLLKLAKQGETIQMQLNLISTIHLCMRYQSSAIKDYKGRITRWLDGLAESEHILHIIAKKTAKVFRLYCAD